MYHKEKLKKVSDAIFQEAEPPKDRSRPLEWRRSLNRLRLDLINVQILDVCQIHETDSFFSSDDKIENHTKSMASAQPSYSQLIKADVDKKNFIDTIFFSVAEEKDSEIYKLDQPSEKISFTIRSGNKHSYKNFNLIDVYPGSIGRNNFEPGEDGIWIEVRMPQYELERIIALIASNPKSKLKASVDILAFTFEVDDAFREWYDPRDMFIDNDIGIALLSSLDLSRSSEIKEATNNHIHSVSEKSTIEENLNAIKNSIYIIAIILAILTLKQYLH